MRSTLPFLLLLPALIGCPPRVREGKTPILQPTPPPGTVTVAPPVGAGLDPQLAAALPLAPAGHNSEQQLAREAEALAADPALRSAFERGFRLTFSTQKEARRPREARELLAPLLQRNFAPAWRVQGYTFVDDGFQMKQAIECYERAVQADEAYGPGHYALAFMLGQEDPQRGRKHFERAMQLGVDDARGLKGRFYP